MDAHNLIHAENRSFVECTASHPASRDEILLNLAHMNGLSDLSDRAYYPWLLFGLFLFSAGGCIIVAIFGSIPSTPFYEDFPMAALFLSAGIMLAGSGWFVLLLIYSKIRSERNVVDQFERLAAARHFAEGKIIEVSSPGLFHQEIRYAFNCEPGEHMSTGTHFTAVKHSLRSGDRVTVLYLNPNIHILL